MTHLLLPVSLIVHTVEVPKVHQLFEDLLFQPIQVFSITSTLCMIIKVDQWNSLMKCGGLVMFLNDIKSLKFSLHVN